ncbi:MAG: hypothetical protein N2556_02235 [Anaerolineae bacterium]|nr:hypothetical protein [Anaerolineae bacterium]
MAADSGEPLRLTEDAQAAIRHLREFNYRRTPERRLHSAAEARAFVEEVGFCHFWPIKGVELPNLLHAIAGRVRPVPMEHDDPDGARCWTWKDDSLGQRWWYYGKLLRRRATLVSLKFLPFFYACSENYGSVDDYLQEYAEGRMTAEAKAVYEALLDQGPLDTVQLRRAARMSAESAKSRFDRALMELEVGLKVLPVGVAEAGAWRYAFIYDLLPRHFPEIPEQAREISRADARWMLVLQYLKTVVEAEAAMIARVFHVLNWTATELERTLQRLLREGHIRLVEAPGWPCPQFIPVEVLERLER